MRLKCWRQPAADTRALSFGKMSTALYLQTEVMILKSSSTNCCTLPGQTSLFDSTESGGALQGMEKLPTVLSMRNIGECPSVANVSMLSLILVENPPTKYYLTVKAMNGILDRASRRGKPLPDLLTTAIAGMKEWYRRNPPGGKNLAYTLKIRQGCDGGGKGALIQTELSATLATNNDQTLFAPVTKE